MTENNPVPAGIDPHVPHVPRILDYLLGGTANFEIDRIVAERAFAAWPGEVGGVAGVRVDIHEARDSLRRIVGHLAGECGIRQFLDIASGLPTMNNTHEAARAVAPGCRVVYVDNDPIVVTHAQHLLSSEIDKRTAFVQGDFRDPQDLLRKAAGTLDFTEPVGVILYGMLHFLADSDGPDRLLDELLAAVPTGSYVAVSHFARDDEDTAMNATLHAMDQQMGEAVVRRTRGEVEKFFNGMDIVEPGVVRTNEWRPEAHGPRPLPMWCGVARKR
ncbi:SAM-dependent methyltransferase [Actinocrispum wychmicini]|uniref:S-adenosyl methyltransferase n=1 Tax=Actinocrispum wychmicini TaxID=1213861 RepID=A0A4R2IQD9_9PSEU|nr:SAM-dependent methyltransferase [Actinocrispum wychmicini]TCO47424.1 S-adenosyl methyltransferase [Actinocrispum wychmicini]